MTSENPLTATWTGGQVAAMEHLHAWTLAFDELKHHQGAVMGLPSTDATALGQIVWAAERDAPLSAGELARQVGLTSGATTALVNRLEVDALVRRHRESSDRRRVTLRPTPEGRERCHAFLALAGAEVAEQLAAMPSETLAGATEFLRRMTDAATQANLRLARHARGR